VPGTWIRAGVLLAVLAVATAAALTVDLPDVATVRRWVAGAGPAGLVLLALAKGIALVGPVPRTALCVLLGVVLGFRTGLVVSLVGGMVGALAAFGLSRTLGRDTAVRLAGPRLAAVDRALAGRGFWAVLVARVLPVAPFAVLSHAAGLSAVPLRAYAAGTAVGLLPATVLQVGVGASVPGLTAWAVRIGSPLGAVAAGVVVGAAVLLWWRRTGSGVSTG
jgi:uncharacterized membrane protein YdjX (TVP38/TMEM64 family)